MELFIIETFPSSGYPDIPTVYAYYSEAEKASRGKHCEYWSPFGKIPGTEPFKVGGEREFIAKLDAENPGKFDRYLISWSNSN